MSAPATYLYCLLHGPGPRPPRLAGAPRGLPGTAAVRALDAGAGLWLVVADAPLARYGAGPIERRLSDLRWVSACAMAHEAVVEHCARLGPVVPARLFTLFASDARALAHVAGRRRAIDRLLRRVAGRQEWGVRLALDPSRAAARPAGARPAGAPRPEGARARAAGTRFLLRKHAEHARIRRLVVEARQEAERVYATLARQADDARRQAPPAAAAPGRLLLDAAFLVPARRARRFRAAARAVARRLDGRGLRLTVSGPWPPYTFVAGRA